MIRSCTAASMMPCLHTRVWCRMLHRVESPCGIHPTPRRWALTESKFRLKLSWESFKNGIHTADRVRHRGPLVVQRLHRPWPICPPRPLCLWPARSPGVSIPVIYLLLRTPHADGAVCQPHDTYVGSTMAGLAQRGPIDPRELGHGADHAGDGQRTSKIASPSIVYAAAKSHVSHDCWFKRTTNQSWGSAYCKAKHRPRGVSVKGYSVSLAGGGRELKWPEIEMVGGSRRLMFSSGGRVSRGERRIFSVMWTMGEAIRSLSDLVGGYDQSVLLVDENVFCDHHGPYLYQYY
jgi:hypothetical protein